MKFEPHEVQNLLNFSEKLIELAEEYLKEVHDQDRNVFINRRGELVGEYNSACHCHSEMCEQKIDIKSFQEWLEIQNIDITEH
jgi:hypothetical protein